MVRIGLVAALVAVVSHGNAQNAQQAPSEMLEHWQRATLSLGRLVTDGDHQRYTTLGSAVLAAVDEHHGCILTARHMVDDPTQNPPWKPTAIQLRFARSTLTPVNQDDLGVTVPLIVNGMHVWQPLEGSDLAVIPPPDLSRYADLHAISVNDFGATEDDVFQGAPVLVLGYPGVIGEGPLSFPIARSGIIAWTDPSDRLGQPFLVDANLMPGNSGGPVFHVRSGLNRFGGFGIGGGLALVGIVSKGPVQDVNLQMSPALGPAQNLHLQIKGLGSIGVIEPASKAKKLVQQYCGP